MSGSGQVRYRLVNRYLEFVAGRCRPNTLWAVAFDPKAFTVIEKDPLEGVARVCAVARRPPTRAVMEG
jgi:hypothetical protein